MTGRVFSREEIAHHESGHVLVAHASWLRHGDVSIVPSPAGDYAGIVKTPTGETIPDVERGNRSRAAIHLSYVVAGPVAHSMFLNDPSWRTGWDGQDYRLAALYAIRGWPDDDHDLVIDQYWEHVSQLLRVPRMWGAVQALAAELLARDELTYEQVAAVVRPCLGEYWGRIWLGAETPLPRPDGLPWATLGALTSEGIEP